MKVAIVALLPLLLVVQADDPEAAVRAAVQQYYQAQAQRDPDVTLSFWSASATPRPTREAFLAVFDVPAEDSFTVDVQAVQLKGTPPAEARVRVTAVRTRLIMRNGSPVTQRASFVNSQIWRREAAGWKLLRDGTVADEIADDLIAAPPADRAALIEANRPYLVQARLAISQRATMAVTLARNYPRGKELFELALEVSRAAGDRRGEANSLHNIAQASYFLGELAGATANYERELAIARDLDDQNTVAAALFGLATVAYSQAEYTPAVGFYREALAVYEKRDDVGAIGRTLVSIGNVQYLQAEHDAAAASYRKGLQLLLEAEDQLGAGFARSGLARVFAAQGDLAAALEMYGQVLAAARAAAAADPRMQSGVAAPLESIAEIYFRLGNTDQARRNFEEARTLFAPDLSSLGRVSASLGLTELVAGHFEAALAGYTESKSRYEQAKDPVGMARAWVGIGFSHSAREKYADAMPAYRTAIRIFDEQKRPEDAARAWLGLSLAQSGALDHAAALASAQRVAATAAAVTSEDLAWRAAVRSGEALRKLGRLPEARAEFERAITAIERLTAEVPINPDARGQIDDSAGAWTGLAFTLAATGAPREAHEVVEARRAHIRRVNLAGFQRDITRGMTADEQLDEQAIVRELISSRAQLRAARGVPHPDSARVQRLEQQLAGFIGRRQEQQDRLYARLPELRQWRGLSPAGGPAAYPLSSDRSLVVEYLVDETEVLIITVARGEDGPDITAAIEPLKRRDVAEQIARTLEPAALADTAEWRTRSAPLAAALLGPIAARLANREACVFVPDDLLWRVPFEALASEDAPLGARMRVTYATSLATLARQQDVASRGARPDAVTSAFFAAPAIADGLRTQLTLAQSGWKPPDEEGAVGRIQELSRPYGDRATVRIKDDASEDAARAAILSADILHIAGPVQISGAAPLFSMLVLAPGHPVAADGPAHDGRWEVREWFRADVQPGRTRLLVIADGSSFGGAGAGSALDTIVWGAAALGIPSLVIARPPADAFDSSALLAVLHRELSHGADVGDAWSTAVNAVRATSRALSAWTGLRLLGPG